jgi:hypothetical protein
MDNEGLSASFSIDRLFEQPCYGLDQHVKSGILTEHLNALTEFHRSRCKPYDDILRSRGFGRGVRVSNVQDFPYLPVRLFKDFDLLSVPRSAVIKTLTSSGTTSQRVSRIFLDRATSAYQTKALVAIIQQYLGKQRVPMLIVDHPNVINDRTLFSARGAGILGLSNFGRDHTYLLNEEMQIDFAVLERFLEKHQGVPVFIFGFTFMVWQYLYQPLLKNGRKLHIPNATLMHSGGWKKLWNQAVDNRTFKEKLKERTEIKSIYNFYGMVEQTGSIFMECEEGRLHASIFSDVIIRNPLDWSVMPHGKEGLIQVLSLLPHSYPGHNLLTEDAGMIYGEDDCPCGRKGKYFSVLGRVPHAEARGCSDTHAASLEATRSIA